MYGGKSSSVVSLTRQLSDNREVTVAPLTRLRGTGSVLDSRKSPAYLQGTLIEQAPSSPMLKFGPYLVDLAAGEVRKNGSRIRLQEKPLRVLALLAERQGQVVTREELKKHLWPEDTFVDFETGLNTAVSKLRDALSDSAETPRYIETIPRRGYRFISQVEFVNGHHAALTDSGNGKTPKPVPLPAPTVEPPVVTPARETAGAMLTIRGALWISLAAAVVILGGGAYWLTHGRAALSFHSNDTVLIADFENQTGDPRFDTALGTAFGVSIAQSRYANVYPRMQLDAVLTRMGRKQGERIAASLGREICQRESIRGLIASSITRTGQEYSLTTQLIDPQTGAPVRSYTERSHGEDHILDALDVLSKEIREALGESLYRIHQAAKPLPQVTTRSLSALQQYAEGSVRWQRGKNQDAITLFRSAVLADPDFAMAHAALGSAYYSYISNAPEDGKKEYEKALSLLSRTTDRERMIIETRYALDQNHVTEADLLFRAYLDRYPDDSVMRFDYANLLRKNERQTDAIEQYKQVLRVAPDFAHAYIGIATASKGLNNFPAALQAYSKAFEIEPQLLTSGNINREYGFALVANGEDRKAEQVFSALLDKPETRENGLRSLAFLDLYHGRYAGAQSRFEQSIDILKAKSSPLSMARLHLLLAIVAEGKGDVKKQRQHLDVALAGLKDIQEKVVFGAMLGDAYARAGYMDPAQKIADTIIPVADRQNAEQMGYVHLLEGEIALSLGQHDRALELLKQSDKENRTGLSIEALAHGYQQSGEIDEAVATYEKMLSLTQLPLSWEPQQRWLEARYALALDYSSCGDKQKARETLATLLNLWKDADPNLPLLKQAKAEYAKLQ
jgi:DNA-binding winged helix-turn-helix (wHTH) protein/tetratricopeptide (TPR) repeat protein